MPRAKLQAWGSIEHETRMLSFITRSSQVFDIEASIKDHRSTLALPKAPYHRQCSRSTYDRCRGRVSLRPPQKQSRIFDGVLFVVPPRGQIKLKIREG